MQKVRAKKRFGQNFLKDTLVLDKIIQTMSNGVYPVVEIGPGLGDLTKRLLEVQDVVAFEVDLDLCKLLKENFKTEIEQKRLTLICRDVLEQWSENLVDFEYNLVANLPYYISTNIILRALRDSNCKSITVMVQKEVAIKFSSQVDDREFSSLSVLTQTIGSAKILFDVLPESFTPAPKVLSSILNIEKEIFNYDMDFEKFLKVAFSQPRKKLSKNLSSNYSKSDIEDSFKRINLKDNYRPHQVSTSNYHQLYKILERGGIDGEYQSK